MLLSLTLAATTIAVAPNDQPTTFLLAADQPVTLTRDHADGFETIRYEIVFDRRDDAWVQLTTDVHDPKGRMLRGASALVAAYTAPSMLEDDGARLPMPTDLVTQRAIDVDAQLMLDTFDTTDGGGTSAAGEPDPWNEACQLIARSFGVQFPLPGGCSVQCHVASGCLYVTVTCACGWSHEECTWTWVSCSPGVTFGPTCDCDVAEPFGDIHPAPALCADTPYDLCPY